METLPGGIEEALAELYHAIGSCAYGSGWEKIRRTILAELASRDRALRERDASLGILERGLDRESARAEAAEARVKELEGKLRGKHAALRETEADLDAARAELAALREGVEQACERLMGVITEVPLGRWHQQLNVLRDDMLAALLTKRGADGGGEVKP
jgi:hypothetical protein